ncbi:hypothetical protein PR048_015936, partial [Dryococelus australis]
MVQMPTTAMTLVEGSLFDEVSYVSNYVDHDVLKRWENVKSKVFGKLNEQQIPYKNCLAIVQYLLCLPGMNAPTERVFSLVNITWTSEKSSLKVETLRVVVIVKFYVGS